MFAVAAETGWPEERILFMPLARLAQYQHCLLRRNGVRTTWSGAGIGQGTIRDQLEALRLEWNQAEDRGSILSLSSLTTPTKAPQSTQQRIST